MIWSFKVVSHFSIKNLEYAQLNFSLISVSLNAHNLGCFLEKNKIKGSDENICETTLESSQCKLRTPKALHYNSKDMYM